MIELAFGLGMQTAQPGIWSALQGDCCNYGATYVYCDGNQRVTQIYWNSIGLNGTINGTAIPSSLTQLYLHVNAIKGNIPSLLPSGLVHLNINSNQMSGDLPSFPSNLQYFYLGYSGYPGNHFTGSLRLNQPIGLRINDNWITDVVIQDSSQIYPIWCDLSNNPLLGNPNIAGLTMCTKNGLYSAGLLPVTKSTTSLVKTTSVLVTTSVVTTTKQLGSSETTTTTLETMATLKRTDGATTMEIKTDFGYTNAHQTSSSEMASGRMWSITMSVTGTQAFTLTSSMGTVQFVQEMSGIVVNLGMMLRCIVSTMILSVVFMKTPFLREIKKMRNKRKTTTTSAPEF